MPENKYSSEKNHYAREKESGFLEKIGVKYYQQMDETLYYFYYALVVIAMLVIEMVVLFWLSLRTVHSLACLTGHHHVNDAVM